MATGKNLAVSASITTGILISIQSFGTKAVLGQEAYRFPPATPVTCSLPQRTEMIKTGRKIFVGEDPPINDAYLNRSTDYLAMAGAFTDQCWKLCKKANPYTHRVMDGCILANTEEQMGREDAQINGFNSSEKMAIEQALQWQLHRDLTGQSKNHASVLLQ